MSRKDRIMICPYCGREFEEDPTEYVMGSSELYGDEGYENYNHECECGETITYCKVYRFSFLEVLDKMERETAPPTHLS